jgi:hypothetical protein
MASKKAWTPPPPSPRSRPAPALTTSKTLWHAKKPELSAKVEAEAAQAQASEDFAKEIETLKAEVERLTAEGASKDEEISALRATSKSAGDQAAAIVASVGLEPVAPVPAEPELSAAQKFAALEGDEATTFYRANKAAILKTFYS